LRVRERRSRSIKFSLEQTDRPSGPSSTDIQEVRAQVAAAAEAVAQLIRFFPDLQVELVHAMSLKGLALSLLHRLRRGTHAVLAGKVYSLPQQLEDLVKAVEDLLASHQ